MAGLRAFEGPLLSLFELIFKPHSIKWDKFHNFLYKLLYCSGIWSKITPLDAGLMTLA